MLPQSLTEIANQYGTDKGTVGPSKLWGGNNYTDIYEPYLDAWRLAPINLLEIGIGVTGVNREDYIAHGDNKDGGGSLKMWYEYFPHAQIYGLDINPATHLDNERIHTFVVDQGNLDDLQRFLDTVGDIEFDVIIDDGSHRPDHQQLCLGFFFRHLKSGGMYFIEDLDSNGLGDHVRSEKYGCRDIVNTRNVLKQFKRSGEFGSPNALIETDYLVEHIAYLNFHNPEPISKKLLSFLAGFCIKSYVLNTESICALRKK